VGLPGAGALASNASDELGEACSAAWLRCRANVLLDLEGGVEWGTGTEFNITVRNVRSRPYAGAVGPFGITVMSAGGEVSDHADADATPSALVPNVLLRAAVEEDVAIANSSVSLTVSFVTSNVVPPDVDFLLRFPPGFGIGPELGVCPLDLSPSRENLYRTYDVGP
jgi:hypothetical protein